MGADSDAYYFCGCLDGSLTLDSTEGQQSGVGPEGVMGRTCKVYAEAEYGHRVLLDR